MGPQSSKSQVAALNHQRQGNGQHRQSYGVVTHMDLWYWLVNHGVSELKGHYLASMGGKALGPMKA